MNYFVTGATGFIGRNLVARLLQREGTIYALVRAGSRGRLEELRTAWGADGARVVPIAGDLAQPSLGVSEEDLVTLRGDVDHFFHLAAIYDMAAGAEAQEVANVEGTRHAVELAGAIEAGCFHQISSIAAAGLYKGTWTEDMFEEAENLDTHPYFRTKHESERVVREHCGRPWRVYRPGIVVGDSRTGEIDKIDGPYYMFKLLQQARRVLPSWLPTLGIEGGRSTSSRSTTSPRRSITSPTSRGSTVAPSASPIRGRRRRARYSTSSPARPTRRGRRCSSTPASPTRRAAWSARA